MSELREKRLALADWATNRGIATNTEALIFIAQQVARQGDIMERDVDAELPKDIEEALEQQSTLIITKYIDCVHRWAGELDEIITRTYLTDMDRARTVRDFQQKLAKFSGIGIDGLMG